MNDPRTCLVYSHTVRSDNYGISAGPSAGLLLWLANATYLLDVLVLAPRPLAWLAVVAEAEHAGADVVEVLVARPELRRHLLQLFPEPVGLALQLLGMSLGVSIMLVIALCEHLLQEAIAGDHHHD